MMTVSGLHVAMRIIKKAHRWGKETCMFTNGTLLDADDCVDSDSTVGSKMSATNLQDASGDWQWSLDTIRGAWTDAGACDP